MSPQPNDPLRIGVIGLGRLWEARHKPALAKLRNQISVVAVYDQVARRAAIEAKSLRCAACTGLRELICRNDVDAIYLLTPQWFGTYPIRIAAEQQKAVYCALPPTGELESMEQIAPLIRDSGIPFMPELARRFYPATLRLRELIATVLGPIKCIIGQTRVIAFDRYGSPGPSTQLAPVPLAIDPGAYLLDWCRFAMGDQPVRVRALEAVTGQTPSDGGPDHLNLILDFSRGRFSHVAIDRNVHKADLGLLRYFPQPGFQVFAERGAAWVEMPDRIVWNDGSGIHEESFPAEPTVGETLNEHFLRLVRGKPTLAPGLDDLELVIRMHHEVRQSLREARSSAG